MPRGPAEVHRVVQSSQLGVETLHLNNNESKRVLTTLICSRYSGCRGEIDRRHSQSGRVEARGAIRLVAVVQSLVRSFDRDAEILGLSGRELGQLNADVLKVSTRDFLVELLGQNVYPEREVLRRRPEGYLCKDLVGE